MGSLALAGSAVKPIGPGKGGGLVEGEPVDRDPALAGAMLDGGVVQEEQRLPDFVAVRPDLNDLICDPELVQNDRGFEEAKLPLPAGALPSGDCGRTG